jgi:hypothetical protein
MIPLGDIEGAARNNPQLRALLKALIDQANLQAQNIGTDPVAAQQSSRNQRVALPGLAELVVTGDNGNFYLTLVNPERANGIIYHEVQSSTTLPFTTSLDLSTYGPSPATARTVNDPSQTKYWRWRSKYANSEFNRWQQLPDAVFSGAGGGGGGTVTSVTGTAPITSSGGTTPDIALEASADSVLFGRGDSGPGGAEEITIGSGLAMTGTVLSSTGAGGDVVGPAGAVDGDVTLFDGPTGKLIKDGGTPSAFVSGAGYWTILTNGDPINPEPIYAGGDVISVWVPL